MTQMTHMTVEKPKPDAWKLSRRFCSPNGQKVSHLRTFPSPAAPVLWHPHSHDLFWYPGFSAGNWTSRCVRIACIPEKWPNFGLVQQYISKNTMAQYRLGIFWLPKHSQIQGFTSSSHQNFLNKTNLQQNLWITTSWWLNQPIWNILVKIRSFPQVGMKIKRYLKPPPRQVVF